MSQSIKNIQYSGWMSRLLLRSSFENQWVMNEPLPKWQEAFFRWHEKWILKMELKGIPVDRAVFILSMPRCGSSMLQDVMCAHPDLGYTTNVMDIFYPTFCSPENFRKKVGLNVGGERFLKDSITVDATSPADPVGTWGQLFGESDPFDLELHPCTAESLGEEGVRRIRDYVRKVLWCHGGPRRFFCKTPMLLPYAEVLAEVFPDARFIHLVRDPRPGANSMVKIHRICNEQLKAILTRQKRPIPEREFVPYPRLPKLPGYVEKFGAEDVRTTAHLWNDAAEYIAKIKDKLPSFYEVRYEDILANPAEEVDKLLEFAELSPRDASDEKMNELIAGIGHVSHKNEYGNFDVIEEVCAKWMEAYGYDRSE